MRNRDGNRGRGGIHRGHRGGPAPWRSGRHYSWGPGIGFYFYDGYYYGDCDWLLRRARATGSAYWWQRYRLCRSPY